METSTYTYCMYVCIHICTVYLYILYTIDRTFFFFFLKSSFLVSFSIFNENTICIQYTVHAFIWLHFTIPA